MELGILNHIKAQIQLANGPNTQSTNRSGAAASSKVINFIGRRTMFVHDYTEAISLLEILLFHSEGSGKKLPRFKVTQRPLTRYPIDSCFGRHRVENLL